MFFLFNLLLLSLTINYVKGQVLAARMNIPMGVPDLDDRFSQGLASYIGIPALPGASGRYGNPELAGRSGSSSAPGNNLNYNDFPSLPGLRSSQAGMTKWYGPEFAPPPFNPRGGPGPFMPLPQQRPQIQQNQPRLNDGSEQVGDLSCQRLRSVIGLSNDRNHWLSTVECECRQITPGRQPEYYCYSLCDPPQAEKRCEATFSPLLSCPTYKNCGNWTQSNETDAGAISCKTGEPVPEAVCWILASSFFRDDDALPLRPAFYANAATGCFMTCICGNDGTIAGEMQCMKTPTSKWKFPVYPRSRKFDFSQPH